MRHSAVVPRAAIRRTAYGLYVDAAVLNLHTRDTRMVSAAERAHYAVVARYRKQQSPFVGKESAAQRPAFGSALHRFRRRQRFGFLGRFCRRSRGRR